MTAVAVKKEKGAKVTVVKKMRDYSKESVFQKKLADAKEVLKKFGLPKSATRKK